MGWEGVVVELSGDRTERKRQRPCRILLDILMTLASV